jgi:choline kinase
VQAIILAAEADGPEREPRALIELAGRSLIDYALAFARAAGAEHRIAVGGCGLADLTRRLDARDPDTVVVDGGDVEQGDLLAFLAGRARLEPGGFLLMGVARIYEPALARAVAAQAARADDVLVFCHAEKPLGLTWVPAARVAAHGDAARRVLDRDGESARVDAALAELAAHGAPARNAELRDAVCLDVDHAEARESASGVLFQRKWWA